MNTIGYHINSCLQAIENCRESGNAEWLKKHKQRLSVIVRHYMPSGCGFDNGTGLHPGSEPNRLVFNTSFHHMDDSGYTGWSEHDVIATPAFDDVHLRITGRDRNDIKDYIYESFHQALTQRVDRSVIDALYSQTDEV